MAFSEETVQRVWDNARAVSDRDPTEWRKDECGAWMRRDHYDSEASELGWKIQDLSAGGDAGIEQLRAFQRDNSFDPAARKPHCRMTADREDVAPTARVDVPRNRPVD
ncbi:MAG: hypothetical protein PVI91_13990 [Gammaproteobacteria bacterium]|jgi:hypothetical protein